MKKIILNYGLISGAVAAALMLGMALYMGNDPKKFSNGEIFGYVGILLSMVVVFLGVRAYRDQEAGGRLSFGSGFKVGILITIISCVCYVLAWKAISNTLMSDFMDQFMKQSLDQMKNSGASAAEIAKKTAEMEHYKALYKNPLTEFALIFLEPFPVGFLVTLASAAILRKK